MSQVTSKLLPAKRYKVAAVSSNVGAFGHRRPVLIAEDGEAWAIHVSISPGVRQLQRGDIIMLSKDRYDGGTIQPNANADIWFEVPERLPDAPRGVVAEVWK